MGHYDNSELSTVEELDPEPSRGEGLSRTREFALGGALLLIVLLWALWQVWTTESKRESYRRGGEAAGLKRWDEARAHYVAASGYKDADSHVAEIAALLSERDRDYDQALGHARNGNWLDALVSAREVLRIDPGYRGEEDIQALVARAEDHVCTDAFLGTVVLRTPPTRDSGYSSFHTVEPTGLYYRAESGWIYLEGSDPDSRLLGIGPRNTVVYDVPGETPGLEGRRSMAASIGDGVEFSPLAFSPTGYNFFIWGERGVWAFRDDGGAISGGPEPPIHNTIFQGLSVDYQAFGSELTSTLDIPGAYWSLLDLSRDGTRTLLAEWEVVEENAARINLYVAGAAGGNPRLLYSHRGGFVGAQFSPDARHVLLAAYTRAYGAESQEALLLDVEGYRPPFTLEERLGYRTRIRSPGTGTFLDGGAFDGWVALAGWDDDANAVKLVNPDDLQANPLNVVAPRISMFYLTAEPEDRDKGGALLYGQVVFGDIGGTTDSFLSVLAIEPTGRFITNNIPLEIPGNVRNLGAQSGYLVYVLEEERREVGWHYSVYSVPLSELNKPRVRPQGIYNGSLFKHYLSLERPWSLGTRLLGYIEDGELHVRTYDGKTDLTLETGATTLYTLDESYRRILR